MERIVQPTIIVIFGISGDLSKRSLMPALEAVAGADVFAEKTRVIGLSRQDLSLVGLVEADSWLSSHLELLQLDPTNASDYSNLAQSIARIENEFGAPAQKLFYLSLPPSVTTTVVTNLGLANLAQDAQSKLLLEKPFGVDYLSARDLIDHLGQYFDEERIYRIDHFLAKEMAQNIIVFRAGNALFKHTWNHEFIEKIDVVLSEKIDIEGRAGFYEQTGAVRDVLQNHVLQLASLVLMDLPELKHLDSVPPARSDALAKLRLEGNIDMVTQRAQYESYRDEVGNPESTTETFAQIRLFSSDERWQGVPITLTAGKALHETTTEIRVTYKSEHGKEPDRLILRIQPNEGIELDIWVKRPGFQRAVERTGLSFAYNQIDSALPKAYERVFVDAIRGDHSLFATSDEILESWRIVDPILAHWKEQGTEGLQFYPKGSDPSDDTL